MFSTLKEQLDLVEVAEDLLQVPFKKCGDVNWEPEHATCPHCGHKDCYRIKKDGADSFFKCFSCDERGDVISLVQKLVKAEDGSAMDAGDAAKWLAKKYNVKLPRDTSPVQEVMDMAAQYYHQCFLDAGPCAELGGMTPAQYQTEKRGRNPDSFQQFQIGWSDGKLYEYLEAMGVAAEIITQSGLVNKVGKDFLPAKSFIYPHKVKGRVSHYTFKDPLKQKDWQLKNANKLNGHSFYNSDSLRRDGPVIVVEGENDLISVEEAEWLGPVICCNGSISQSQLEWMELNLSGRDVITIYDTDAAGDKYRDKTKKHSKGFNSLTQIKIGNGLKDIDEYLKQGGDLAGLLSSTSTNAQSSTTSSEGGLEIEGEVDGSPVQEHRGAYYKVKYKDGNEYKIKLTNFTIKLLNIFIRGAQREREIVIIREDGKQSEPLMIPSEAKVSLKPFKTLVANAIDASFYGKEEDMIAIWEHVYKTSKEVIVHLPECVGYVKEFKGWLFGDGFISETGAVYKPDENGVIWVQNKTIGLRAQTIETNGGGDDQAGVPKLMSESSSEEREALIGGVLTKLAQNLGQPGAALNVMAWAWASVYSEKLYNAFGHFPFIYQWGTGGRGKTTIQKWILSFYDMEQHGWTPANQLNSGVSFSRKLSYYSSLPMCVDEVKLEKPIQDMYGTFRSWYNRGGRTVASEGSGIRTQAVRSSIMFGGEDQFADPSTRQRCIHVRIPKHGREEKESYHWIDSRRRDLPSIGYHWILDSTKTSVSELVSEVKRLDGVLREGGISSRTSLNWAMIAYFGLKLASKYMPEFNYMEYMFEAAREDVERQTEDNTLTEFWNVVEGLQSAGESPKINSTHLKREGDNLYVWMAEVFRIVQKEEVKKDAFSKRAVMESLREEDYFKEETREKMGMGEVQRRVFVLDLSKAPEVVQQIASMLA
jgi:5S rRNA maturation endonuclease (ribonuclease M5)